MIYVVLYQLVVAVIIGWLIGFAYVGLDKYDRQYIRWGEIGLMVLLLAFLWPLVLLLKPGYFLHPGKVYKQDSYTAMRARERDRVRREMSRCASSVQFRMGNGSESCGEFLFPTDAMARYLALRSTTDGYGVLGDLADIQEWVSNADYMNTNPSEVPWIWDSFKLLAAEMIEAGIGSCLCASCQTRYENNKMETGFGDGSPGWIAVIVRCPKGHEVMKFDLMKPFCSTRSNAVPDRL